MSETTTTTRTDAADPTQPDGDDRPDPDQGRHSSPSFAKSLFVGELHQDLMTPYPTMARDEQSRVAALIRSLYAITDDLYDVDRIEQDRWIGEEVTAALGEAGLMGPRRREVRWPGPVVDRLLPGQRGVRPDRRDARGRHRRAPVDRLQGHPPVRFR